MSCMPVSLSIVANFKLKLFGVCVYEIFGNGYSCRLFETCEDVFDLLVVIRMHDSLS